MEQKNKQKFIRRHKLYYLDAKKILKIKTRTTEDTVRWKKIHHHNLHSLSVRQTAVCLRLLSRFAYRRWRDTSQIASLYIQPSSIMSLYCNLFRPFLDPFWLFIETFHISIPFHNLPTDGGCLLFGAGCFSLSTATRSYNYFLAYREFMWYMFTCCLCVIKVFVVSA